MFSSLKSPMLLALVALFFAIGHGHQIFERFEIHDHADPAHHHGDREHSDHDAPTDGEKHSMGHHAVVAVIEVDQEPLYARLEMLSTVKSVAVLPPDEPVLGIEHPPQIAIG